MTATFRKLDFEPHLPLSCFCKVTDEGTEMASGDDPRIERACHWGPATGARFRRKAYRAHGPDWMHDHCVGCGITIAEYAGPGYLHEGFVAITEAAEEEWVCPDCFKAIAPSLGWTDDEEAGS